MKLAMAMLQLGLVQLFIFVNMVDCHSQQQRSPTPLLLEDPSGYYSVLNGTGTEGSSMDQQFLRRTRAGMFIRSGFDHSLAKFLLDNQRQFVCPDEKLCTMENYRDWSGGKKTGKSFLPGYGLFCTDREWFSPEDNQLVIFTLQFRLIPGVCFTRYQHLSFCDKPKIIFPSDSKCVAFFKDENCSGGARETIYATGLNMLEDEILQSKSFAFC